MCADLILCIFTQVGLSHLQRGLFWASYDQGGGGGGSKGTPSDLGPEGLNAAKLGMHLRNFAKRKTLVLLFAKAAYVINYDNSFQLYA